MKHLFKSQTAYELLELFTRKPHRSFYMNELATKLQKDPANITREINKLVDQGIVSVATENKKKYYSFNTEHLSSQELVALLDKERSTAITEKFDTEWLLAEEIPNMDPFFAQIWLNCFVDEFESPGGKAYNKIAAIFKDYYIDFYFDADNANAVGEHLVDRFVDKPKFMQEVNRNIVVHSDQLRKLSEKLPETNLEKLSNKKLWDWYKKHDDEHTAYYQWGWIPVAADMFCNNLTDRGKNILKSYGVADEDVDSNLATLTEPTESSLLKEEQNNLIKIGIEVQKDSQQLELFKELFRKFKEEDVKEFGLYTHSPEYEEKFAETVKKLRGEIRSDILDALEQHYATYFYTKFIFTEEQGTYSFEHFLKALVRLVTSNDNLVALLTEEEAHLKKVAKQQEDLRKKLKLSKEHELFFQEWGQFMITKIYRRYAQLFALYKMMPLLTEIGNRLALTVKQVKFMTSDEIKNALLENDYDAETIKKRVQFCVYYADKESNEFMIGKPAEDAVSFIRKDNAYDLDEIQGQCGARGTARGIVKIVNVVADMPKMQEGDVLVAISTQPDLVPAMKKASAFITDQGGVTAHAAIVAREMRTPCVIGTKIATKVLKDGDEVEVDADKGLVTIIKRA